MGSLLDDAPARALHLLRSRKLVAVTVSGMVAASAARSGLVLDEDSNCMGGAIGAFSASNVDAVNRQLEQIWTWTRICPSIVSQLMQLLPRQLMQLLPRQVLQHLPR